MLVLLLLLHPTSLLLASALPSTTSSSISYYSTLRSTACGKSVRLKLNKTHAPDSGLPNRGVIIGFAGTAFVVAQPLFFEPEAFANLGYTFYEATVRVHDTHKTLAGCGMQDARDAIKHIASSLEPSPATKFFLYGGSSGGTLVLNTLADLGQRIRAVALVSGVIDLVHFFHLGGQKKILPTVDYAKKLSPMIYVPSLAAGKLPPMLFIAGTKDIVAPLNPTLTKFVSKLAAAKFPSHTATARKAKQQQVDGEGKRMGDASAPFRIVTYAGEPHTFQHLAKLDRRTWLRQDIIARVHHFFSQFEV